MKLILLTFTLFIWNNVSDVNKGILDIKETTDPIIPPKTILIIGDSQSAIKTKSGESITWTWPSLLQKKLKPYGVTIDVEAIGGKTSSWMLSALKKRFQSGSSWDRVILYGGGNDASNMSIPLDTTISNFQKMIDISNSHGCDVFVNLILALTFDVRVGTKDNPPSNISVITFIEELNSVLSVFVP